MDCGHILNLGYGEFSQRLHGNLSRKRIPIQGSIDITARCNLRCAHCYIQGTSFEEELSSKDIYRIFDQIAEEGCLWLLITGGEPLLRHDFADIYKYAKSLGFLIGLYTNGTLLTPRIADLLAEYPPFVVEISLYGMTASTYERITGIPGSFQRCIRGINLLVERKIRLQLKTMVMTLNRHELEDMKQYAKSLGLRFRYDSLLNAKLNGSDAPAQLRLSPCDVINIDLADEERVLGFQDLCNQLWGAPHGDRLYLCGAGINSFHITASGGLAECILARRTNYNVCRGTFREGFYEAIPKVITQKRTRQSECQSCPMISLCGNCVAWGLLEHGDPEAKVDYLCEIAHLRANAFKTGWQEGDNRNTMMTTPAARLNGR
jgi:radical SAM protein with 4Fe4S-binding SPASM domain